MIDTLYGMSLSWHWQSKTWPSQQLQPRIELIFSSSLLLLLLFLSIVEEYLSNIYYKFADDASF